MTSTQSPGEAPQGVFLDAVLAPYRSLPPRGFTALMAVLGTASLIAGVTCVMVGAWPVFGFFGLDVLLVYLAFRLSYRSARQRERIRLTERDLLVERVSEHGEERRWRFEPYWLRIVFEERDEHSNRLLLASHGRTLVLGSFLGPGERRRFARSLQDALERWRRWLAG